MGNEICFIRGKNDKVPVELNVFKHGGGVYLAIGNQAENVHLALIGSAAAMVVELRLKADMIEAAMVAKDQGHISRPQNLKPTIADLTGDPRHDFPVFVRRFAKTSPDILGAIANHYKTLGYKVPGVEAIVQAYDDLEVIWEIRLKIINDRGELVYGARNRIAKALAIRDAGNYRQRIDTVIWLLKHTPLEDFGVGLEESGPVLEVLPPKAPVSNSHEARAKAVNE